MTSFTLAQPGPSFLGAPTGDVEDVIPGGFAIIGAPFGRPYTVHGRASGASHAPLAIRTTSARYNVFGGRYDFDLGGPFFDPNDCGLIDLGDCVGPVDQPESHAELIEERVRAVTEKDALPIVLGGDDSTPIPIGAGLDRFSDIHVLQIDAHLDFRDEVNGHRLGYSSPMRRISEMAHFTRIVNVGARGMGSARVDDHDDMLAAGHKIITARDVARHGVGAALAEFPDGANVYITIDCDGFDPAVMPGTSVPLPGGLQFYDAVEMIHDLIGRCNLRGIGFAEHFPEFDQHNVTAVGITRLICNVIGVSLNRRATNRRGA